METIKELKQTLKDHNELSFLLDYINDETELEDFEDIARDAITEQEIIYYHKAIDFLRENDDSLLDSIELAKEMHLKIEDISSELLATLLHQNQLSQALSELLA